MTRLRLFSVYEKDLFTREFFQLDGGRKKTQPLFIHPSTASTCFFDAVKMHSHVSFRSEDVCPSHLQMLSGLVCLFLSSFIACGNKAAGQLRNYNRKPTGSQYYKTKFSL
jgi:hypothetical protein